MSLAGVFALLTAFAFTVALVLAARLPVGGPGFDRVAKMSFISAMFLFAVVAISNSLEHLDVTSVLDQYEDYFEIMFVPILAYGAYLWQASFQMHAAQETSAHIGRQDRLLADIFETTPTGLIVVDGVGRITQANQRAQEILGLDGRDESGCFRTPPWTLRDSRRESGEEGEPGVFDVLPCCELEKGLGFFLTWPDGRRQVLTVNCAPAPESDDGERAHVISIDDVSYRKAFDSE
jgi:PAS domain-containing protein